MVQKSEFVLILLLAVCFRPFPPLPLLGGWCCWYPLCLCLPAASGLWRTYCTYQARRLGLTPTSLGLPVLAITSLDFIISTYLFIETMVMVNVADMTLGGRSNFMRDMRFHERPSILRTKVVSEPKSLFA